MSKKLDTTKTLDAKVQIHRLAKLHKEVIPHQNKHPCKQQWIHRLAKLHKEVMEIPDDMPYPSLEERERGDEIIFEIRSITKQVIFKNEVDQADFRTFMNDLFPDQEFEYNNPMGSKIHDEQLTEELDEGEAIPQIKAIQQRKSTVEEEIAMLQKAKKDMELQNKRNKLMKEVDKMKDKIREDTKEENFLTDKKDKDGIVKLRHLKYNMRMDDLKLARIELDKMLEVEKDPDKIETLKEAIKINKGKVMKLRQLKLQTYIQNYMIKIPQWIAKGSKSINEISGSLGGVGNSGKSDGFDMSQMQVGSGNDNPFGGKGGGNPFGGDYPFGKGSDDPFDLSGLTGQRSTKKSAPKKKKRKQSKKKKGKKK